MRVFTLSACSLAISIGGAAGQGASAPRPQQLEVCLSCHGEDGNSRTPMIPSIAGQPEFFVTNQLIYMREGVRPTPPMTPFVEKLTDPEIEALARAIAALPAARSDETVDPALVARGRQARGAIALRLLPSPIVSRTGADAAACGSAYRLHGAGHEGLSRQPAARRGPDDEQCGRRIERQRHRSAGSLCGVEGPTLECEAALASVTC